MATDTKRQQGTQCNASKHATRRLSYIAAAIGAMTLAGTTAADYSCGANTMAIYLAPDGDDYGNGRSIHHPIRTLRRAHDIVRRARPHRDVDIVMAPGRYISQHVTWTYTMPNHTIRFLPLDTRRDVIFDGCEDGNIWFTLRSNCSEPTNIHIEGLRIERYRTAIRLLGDRNDEHASVSGNVISGNKFINIGNSHAPHKKASSAAIRMENADDNEIVNNLFKNISNASNPTKMRAVFISHMSDRNTVLGNTFFRVSGDPIRVRDFSNDNVITSNTFRRSGDRAAYSEWFDDCDERPSWNNKFYNNTLYDNFLGRELCDVKLHQPKPKSQRFGYGERVARVESFDNHYNGNGHAYARNTRGDNRRHSRGNRNERSREYIVGRARISNPYGYNWQVRINH